MLAHARSVAVLRTGIIAAEVVAEAAVSSEEDENKVQRSSNRDRDRSGEAYQRRQAAKNARRKAQKKGKT